MVDKSLPVTAQFAGILGVAFALASLVVGLTRVGCKKFYGAEINTTLQFRSRAAGTIGEYGAFGLLLLALLEYNQALSSRTLWWWGLSFTIFRLTHALQLAVPRSLPLLLRAGSFLSTVALLVFAGLTLIFSLQKK